MNSPKLLRFETHISIGKPILTSLWSHFPPIAAETGEQACSGREQFWPNFRLPHTIVGKWPNPDHSQLDIIEINYRWFDQSRFGFTVTTRSQDIRGWVPKVANISLPSDSLRSDVYCNMAADRCAEEPMCFPITKESFRIGLHIFRCCRLTYNLFLAFPVSLRKLMG